MKVLILGSHMNYNLEHFMYMNLKRLGHLVTFCGYKDSLGQMSDPVRILISRSDIARTIARHGWLNRINDCFKRSAKDFLPDLVLTIKGEVVSADTISWIRRECGAKTALWYPDDPRFFPTLVEKTAPSYDCVFTVSEKMIPAYRRIGVKHVFFLPVACEPSVHRSLGSEGSGHLQHDLEVTFVGTYTRRRLTTIHRLQEAGIRVAVFGPYWKYFDRSHSSRGPIYGEQLVRILNRSKFVLNVSADSDLAYKVNMRIYETTGCGSFLATDCAYGLGTQFVPSKELVTYSNVGELAELVRYYRAEDKLRQEIAAAGQKRAYRDHTYLDRASRMLSFIASTP